MVTEGFDCPEIATIAYATNIIADLFIAQTMARAMRITLAERAQRLMLPAQILIPDDPAMRRAFASALASALHMVEEPKDEDLRDPTGGNGDRLPRYKLLDLSDPRLRSATVLTQSDGEVKADELALYVAQCLDVGIPETYAPRVAVVSRRYRPPLRVYAPDTDDTATTTVATKTKTETGARGTVTVTADPRTLNKAHRTRLSQAVGWMHDHMDHETRYANTAAFQSKINEAVGIPPGGRDQAIPEQLIKAANWALARIVEHCRIHGEPVPNWAEAEETDVP
jgi:superfamily II DNA or RNA helicase